MAAFEDNYLRLASAHRTGKALLAGLGVSLLAFAAGAAFGLPAVLVLSGAVGSACLYGALIAGYRDWRDHYDFWAAAGLTEEQIRQKWRDQYDART